MLDTSQRKVLGHTTYLQTLSVICFIQYSGFYETDPYVQNIAEAIGKNRSSASKHVDSLLNATLLERVSKDSDSRKKVKVDFCGLGDIFRCYLQEKAETYRDDLESFESFLREDERTQLRKTINRLENSSVRTSYRENRLLQSICKHYLLQYGNSVAKINTDIGDMDEYVRKFETMRREQWDLDQLFEHLIGYLGDHDTFQYLNTENKDFFDAVAELRTVESSFDNFLSIREDARILHTNPFDVALSRFITRSAFIEIPMESEEYENLDEYLVKNLQN